MSLPILNWKFTDGRCRDFGSVWVRVGYVVLSSEKYRGNMYVKRRRRAGAQAAMMPTLGSMIEEMPPMFHVRSVLGE
jgi:hypothetical protein